MEALIARSVQILIALGGAYVLALWFAVVVWTFQDIQARSRSVVAQIFSTLVVLIFSIPGLLIYMILRPRYTLDDAFQRSLEEEYLMQDLEELPLCPGCQQYVEDEWVFCPNCRNELRDNCISCDQLIDLRWEICPYCGTEQYEDADAALPPPVVQPVMTPSPQFLGRPHLSQTQVFLLASDQEASTRPILPATIRVDLRSGDVATEQVPELPMSSPTGQLFGHGDPRRVSLDGNGHRVIAGSVEPGANAPEVADSFLADFGPASDEELSTATNAQNPSEIVTSEDRDAEVVEPEDGASAEAAHSIEADSDEADPQPAESTKKRRKRRSRRKKSQSSAGDEESQN